MVLTQSWFVNFFDGSSYWFFKWNCNPFLLNAILDVRCRLCRRIEMAFCPYVMTGVVVVIVSTKCGSRISLERFDLESSNFAWTFKPVGSTTTPDMTSLCTSGRKLSAFEKRPTMGRSVWQTEYGSDKNRNFPESCPIAIKLGRLVALAELLSFVLGSCLGRNFSITLQPILNIFTIWTLWFKRIIFSSVTRKTVLLLDPENGAKMGLPSAMFYAGGWIWFSRKLLKQTDSKFLNSVALNSLYNSAGNDVTNYFQTAANRINVFIWGWSLGCDFLIVVQPIPKKICSFGNCDSRASFPRFLISSLFRHFCFLTPKNGGSSGRTVVYALRSWLIAVFSLYTSMHFINGLCQARVILLSRSIRHCESILNVFGRSDSQYNIRQSLWDEWRRVSHCPINWWAFLFSHCWTFPATCIFV